MCIDCTFRCTQLNVLSPATYVKYFITKVPSLMYRLIFRAVLSLTVTRARFQTCILIIRPMIYSFYVFPLYTSHLIYPWLSIVHFIDFNTAIFNRASLVCFYEYFTYSKIFKFSRQKLRIKKLRFQLRFSIRLKNSIEIRKNLNRCNSEDSDFRSTNERSLEARNLAL